MQNHFSFIAVVGVVISVGRFQKLAARMLHRTVLRWKATVKTTYYRPLAVGSAMLISLLLIMPAQAQSPVPREQLEQMFANIVKDTKWDMSREMLWGYFFTHPTRQPLERVSRELSQLGYRVVNISLSDKGQSTDPDLWWLHVERVETHSVASLHKRNIELTAFAKRHDLGSYDGMDVGPVGVVKN
jgi:hypothetical protein